VAAHVIEIGTVVSGKYRLLRLLGDGGMGSVYEAQHEMLGTRVAIKVLHSDLARKSGLVDRFLQEAKVAAQIKSPNVVHVTDVDRTPQGTAYIVMELLEGEALSSVLERDRNIPIPISVDYTKQILSALDAAHALGVTHRDLKPENVFVTFVAGKPVIKLIDFGIAKLRSSDPQVKNLTVAGVVMGTAEYMAPEQAYSADKADARSDIYAVGVMLYEMIAGMRPVAGDDARIIAARVERGEVKPLVHAAPDVPRELAGLVHRAMAARPELRFASATEMRLALEAVPLTPDGKRAPTHQLPQAGGAAATNVHAPATSPGAAASAHGAELGLGTMLGAPADAAFLSPGPAQGAVNDFRAPARGTAMGDAPMEMAHAQPMMHGHHGAMAYADTRQEAPRRKKSSLWILLALPLLLGPGVAVAFYMSQLHDTPEPKPPATTSPTVTPTADPTPTTPTTPATVDTIAPLNTTPTPAHPSTARPTTPSSTTTGSAAKPPDTTNPPTLPFPSSFPNPFPSMSGVPTFPTTFPTTFPSTFPFPGMQPPPAST
jgi:serine/threonine-protein kinase